MANVPRNGAPGCNTTLSVPACGPFLRVPVAKGGRGQPGVGEAPAGWVLSSRLSPRAPVEAVLGQRGGQGEVNSRRG